jgi:hypothetical protein
VLARPGSVHVALQLVVLHPQSAPLQPSSHAQVLQSHEPWSLHVLRFTSTGQGKTDSLQNVPVQPVPVGQSHAPHAHAPPLAAHAASHGAVEQAQPVPFHPPSHEQTPHSQAPWPAQGRPLAAGAHGENEMLQWGPL